MFRKKHSICMEQAKTKHYLSFLQHMGLQPASLVPVVFETSGRPGTDMRRLVRQVDLQRDATSSKPSTQLINQLAWLLWRGNCHLLQAMASLARRIMRQAPN